MRLAFLLAAVLFIGSLVGYQVGSPNSPFAKFMRPFDKDTWTHSRRQFDTFSSLFAKDFSPFCCRSHTRSPSVMSGSPGPLSLLPSTHRHRVAACRFIFNNMTKYSDYTWTNITKESSPRFWWWMARNYLSLSFYSDLFLQMHLQLFCSVLFLQRHNHSLQLWCCCGVVHTHNPKCKLHTFIFIKRIRRL